MDPKELRGLVEAYSEVYAPQEEIEEAEKWIQGAIKKPGALHKQLGVPAGEKIPAEKLAAAAKKGGKLGQRARLAQTLKGLKEEETEIDEAVKGADTEMRKAASAERRDGDRPLSKKVGDANAAHMARKVRFADKVTKAKGHMPGYTYSEEVEQVDEKIIVTRGTSTNAAGQKIPWTHSHNTATGRSSVKDKFGQRDVTDKNPKLDRASDKIKSDTMSRKKGARYEQVDIFDLVLEFLQAEGFAETLEEAEWMMANVINEEAIGIILGEAQVANRDPEKYEREQAKKTPKGAMPPRGDKRREDFEKWYAANVR